jgi:5-methylcytosine-specific restriction endonuclease McrBC regulatory subunit McrC
LLAGALEVLRRGRDVSRTVRATFGELEQALEGVTPWPPSRPSPSLEFHRLNAHYEPAVRLAKLILQGATRVTLAVPGCCST